METQNNSISKAKREYMEFDVVIVGAGPSGLAAAIKLKQLSLNESTDLNIVVIEKGSEVGSHILSGAVINTCYLDELIPDWQEKNAPIKDVVTKDEFLFLSKKKSYRFPNFLIPNFMKNHNNYIVSLGNVCKWLADQARSLGVEIYPGFAASEIIYDDQNNVKGIATGDMGVDHKGKPKEGFTRGMELHGKYVLFAEGARGSLSKQLIEKFALDTDREQQKYAIGIKEIWEVEATQHKPGLVQHTMGWPLDNKTGGGSFIYHHGTNLVSIGFVIHLDYENPYLSPFDEMQRFKTHPKIKDLLSNGKRISYGARALTEGGYQSVPKLVFPGGALIGCAAGFMNVPQIKGSHNAIKTGILAAESCFNAIKQKRCNDTLLEYQNAYEKSQVAKELKLVRNVKPLWSKYGLKLGIMLGGFDMWCNTFGFSFFGTMKHGKSDHAKLSKSNNYSQIQYPKPDGILTFDKLSSVYLTAVYHEEDQPIHLKLTDPNIPITSNLTNYDEPAQRYCPAGVYEIINGKDGKPFFQINAQNCIHCKTCDIKDPSQNINWTTPEGGGGPNYANM